MKEGRQGGRGEEREREREREEGEKKERRRREESQRMPQGLAETALLGDLLRKRDSGGLFWCDDPKTDTQRIAEGELVVTGPIPGVKARRAKDDAGQREEQALIAGELNLEAFRVVKRLAPGGRRDALAFPTGCELRREADDLVLAFMLPSGCYATVLLELLCGQLTPWTAARIST